MNSLVRLLSLIDLRFNVRLHFKYRCFTVCALILICGSSCTSTNLKEEPSAYLQAVQIFADNVLEHGMDRYGEEHSPLFADGINVETGEPMQWHYDGNSWVISNFASQQNLLRVLVSLTEMTGEGKYRETADNATRYMFENQTNSQGLLYWGGHQFVDLVTLKNQFESRPHELKNNFPFYEFLWEVAPEAFQRLLRAMWNTHILNWEVLDLNRHGAYDSEMGMLWDHEFDQPEPFFEGRGLTFINAGTDMIQAAMALYAHGGEEGAREWGLRLYEQYVRARHPETGLGVYQYSQPIQRNEPPAEGPLVGELTFSGYEDRAKNQFGHVYGGIALEGNVLWGGRVSRIYGQSAVMLLHLAEQLGENILEKHFHNGYFQPSEDHIYARFDDPEPLALLLLEATRRGMSEMVPSYLTGTGMTDGEYEGLGRITDHRLYNKTK